MIEMQKRTVDGDVYEFSQFGTKESLRVLSKLSKILGKPIALGFAALGTDPKKPEPEVEGEQKKSLFDREINKEILAQAIDAFTERLDENEVIDLIETLAGKNVLCNGKPVIFNSHYEGKIAVLFKVVAAALEVQYGNFFDALSGPRS